MKLFKINIVFMIIFGCIGSGFSYTHTEYHRDGSMSRTNCSETFGTQNCTTQHYEGFAPKWRRR